MSLLHIQDMLPMLPMLHVYKACSLEHASFQTTQLGLCCSDTACLCSNGLSRAFGGGRDPRENPGDVAS